MRRPLGVALATGISAVGVQGHYQRSLVREELVTSPRMHEVLDLDHLPRELDWRSKGGLNLTTVTRNQHIPLYCGACYVFGSTSALSDRFRIAAGGAGIEVNLAMQVVLNCDKKDLGCNGGDGLSVYRWMKQHGGIPDETCQPYEARGHDTGNTCEHKDICRKCDSSGCVAQPRYAVYGVEQYGVVAGEHQMKAELQRGPIACAIATPDDFIKLHGWDVYEDASHSKAVDHIISIVGYGTDDGKDYWILRNSWGTYWGYYGWARVLRGTNNLMVESDCVWATPSNGGRPTWRHVDVKRPLHGEGHGHREDSILEEEATSLLEERRELAEAREEGDEAEGKACRVPRSDWAAVGGERVTKKRPHETLKKEHLPAHFDWRNVSGRSYISWNTNERLPHHGCASCWAHAVTSALADRIAVKRNGAWPQVGLSPQVLLNCRAGGSCDGGDPAGAYAYIAEYGITDQTCQNYQATEFSCKGKYVCMDCAPGGEHGLIWPGVCVAVPEPVVFYISEYGAVRGAVPMKAEIYQRGPISCGLHATRGFRSYEGGIYHERRETVTLTHQVSLTGWGAAEFGKDAGSAEFWVGRNSWGTYWGEDGWFRLMMHRDNLGVETECDWGVPEGDAAPVPSTRLSSEEDDPGFTKRLAAIGLVIATKAVVMICVARYAWRSMSATAAARERDDSSYVLVE